MQEHLCEDTLSRPRMDKTLKKGLQILGKGDQRDERCHQEQQAGAAGAGAVAVVALTAGYVCKAPGNLRTGCA